MNAEGAGRVCAQIAFVLADGLPGANCAEDDVLAATAGFAPALLALDAAGNACWEVGTERVSPKDVDIASVEVVMWRNGEVVAQGSASVDPVRAVTELTREAAAADIRIAAAEVVFSGPCAAVEAAPGDEFIAEFAGLGSVSLLLS
ncbi:hypothetical protein [Mycolicibacterium brumae]|uniref:hypothetical protein n=1 Tax=Mycolicibacterium brumae TaxID=85968 RepID=UPI000AE34777|nr:hypothetical protein [Mycolicibacterium brumae]MCV7191361.1 hypothetical protein [Mycolicibacterium brumae]UWW07384.1 hypothetical protein L2Z93_000390 [Mycolicibacterium brumae]